MRKKILCLSFTLLLFMLGCASSRLVNMWKDPSFNGEVHNVLVVGLGRRASSERIYEDTFASELRKRGINATPAYEVFGDEKPRDEHVLREQVRAGGYDGLIITALAGVEQNTRYVPGYTTYIPRVYRSYWGNYYFWYDRIHSPGHVANYRTVRLETSVWKIGGDERLIWTGTSETLDPGSVESASKEVVNLVAKQLEKEHVIAEG
jgi:hypothetical protein